MVNTERAVREAEPIAARSLVSPFLFTLRTKGAVGMAGRVATVAGRFGPTPRVMVRRLERMLQAAADAGFQPTCPVTATVLARHPDCIRSLADRGMEFAVHGLRHNDHLAQDQQTQAREVVQALRMFARFGLAPTGFRAPYLRADDTTRAAVRAAGLSYQSDDALAFPIDHLRSNATDDDAYQRALTMYDAQDATRIVARPTMDDGLVRIPVCVPDDEMLVDRLHFDDASCAQAWSDILDATHVAGDLFTMQIHPERFLRSRVAVEAVLARTGTRRGRVWSARLDEIAQWWRARAACRIRISEVTGGQVTYTLEGDHRARMRLVDGAAASEPVRQVTVSAHRRPEISLGVRAGAEIDRFLAEDGFVISMQPANECAMHIDHADVTDQVGLRRRVLDCGYPVLVLDRWPDGAQSAFALTGDIDALTVQDFIHRVRENAHGVPASVVGADPL
jgi:peptidoglycan/xylan/chitin deacetylase (PgdA/CDA1 family)